MEGRSLLASLHSINKEKKKLMDSTSPLRSKRKKNTLRKRGVGKPEK